MQVWQICGVGMICAVAAMVVRQLKGEAATSVRLGGSIVLLTVVLGLIAPLCVFLGQLSERAGFGEYAGVLTKALGIALMTHIAAGFCRDCGESSVAGYVELAGKCEILLLSLPLIASLMDTARDLLSWPG